MFSFELALRSSWMAAFGTGAGAVVPFPRLTGSFGWPRYKETGSAIERVLRVLRAMGWKVMRIWEHELETDSDGVLRKVMVLRLTARRGG